ncbi:unnamed protein product, partial [Urochloa humidicola]
LSLCPSASPLLHCAGARSSSTGTARPSCLPVEEPLRRGSGAPDGAAPRLLASLVMARSGGGKWRWRPELEEGGADRAVGARCAASAARPARATAASVAAGQAWAPQGAGSKGPARTARFCTRMASTASLSRRRDGERGRPRGRAPCLAAPIGAARVGVAVTVHRRQLPATDTHGELRHGSGRGNMWSMAVERWRPVQRGPKEPCSLTTAGLRRSRAWMAVTTSEAGGSSSELP